MKTNPPPGMELEISVVGAPITAAPTGSASKKTNKTNRTKKKKNKDMAVAQRGAQRPPAVKMTTNPSHMHTNPSFAHKESLAVTIGTPTASKKTNKSVQLMALTNEEWRAKFVDYYTTNAPTKLSMVTDEFMTKWEGKYDKLWAGVIKKYGEPGHPIVPGCRRRLYKSVRKNKCLVTFAASCCCIGIICVIVTLIVTMRCSKDSSSAICTMLGQNNSGQAVANEQAVANLKNSSALENQHCTPCKDGAAGKDGKDGKDGATAVAAITDVGTFESLTVSGATTLTADTVSSSKTTGTLVVTGGVGVSGQVTSDTVKVVAGTTSSSETTGSLVVTGGVGVSGQVTTHTVESIAGMTVGGAMALNGNTVVGDAASDTLTVTATIAGASPLTFEGSTDDDFETILAVGNPSEDKTLTLPTETGTLLTEISAVSTAITGVGTLESLTVSGATTIASASGGVDIARTGAATTVKGSLNVKEAVTLDKNTASTDKTTGTLVVTGGVGVSGQVTAESMKTIADMTVGGASTLKGNVVVEGTLTNKDGVEFLTSVPAVKVTNLGAAQSIAVSSSSTSVEIGGVGQTSLAMMDPAATGFETTADTVLNKYTGEAVFGRSVAISGEFAIVGAPGNSASGQKAFIFKNTGGTWGTTAAFTLDQNTGDSGFGGSVAISGEFAIVGASGCEKAFIFKNTGGTWGTTAAFDLDKNTGDSHFGAAVAISGDFAIVGSEVAEKAWIFQNTGGTWDTNAAVTLDQYTDSWFGTDVAISGKFAIVGAPKNSVRKAFIFEYTGGTWGTTAAFTLDENLGEYTYFGNSVAISGEFAIVGAVGAKKAFIYKYNKGEDTWGTTAAFTLDKNTGHNNFGGSVAISGEFAMVGAYGAKKAFIFKNTGGTWGTTAAFTLDKNTGNSNFGKSVAISSEFAIVGADNAKKAFIFKNPKSQISTISGATAGDVLVLSVAAGKKMSIIKGGNIKIGSKDIALDGDNGDTVSLLYDGTNWLITSKNIND